MDPVVKNPPSNKEDAGSIPGPGWEVKIPHALEQLSLWATTRKSQHALTKINAAKNK